MLIYFLHNQNSKHNEIGKTPIMFFNFKYKNLHFWVSIAIQGCIICFQIFRQKLTFCFWDFEAVNAFWTPYPIFFLTMAPNDSI